MDCHCSGPSQAVCAEPKKTLPPQRRREDVEGSGRGARGSRGEARRVRVSAAVLSWHPIQSAPQLAARVARTRTEALTRRSIHRDALERGGGGLTLLLDNCSLKGFGTGKICWPILLVGCGWLLLIPGAPWVVAIIHPQVAPETVNLKDFPGPRLRLPPALEEGWGLRGGGLDRGGGPPPSIFFVLMCA